MVEWLPLFDMYLQDTVFKSRYRHPWNDFEQVTQAYVVWNDSFVLCIS